MIIFTNNKSTKFCQITLRIKRFIDKRKAVPVFLPHGIGCLPFCRAIHER